jgi:hypothetical protein
MKPKTKAVDLMERQVVSALGMEWAAGVVRAMEARTKGKHGKPNTAEQHKAADMAITMATNAPGKITMRDMVNIAVATDTAVSVRLSYWNNDTPPAGGAE